MSGRPGCFILTLSQGTPLLTCRGGEVSHCALHVRAAAVVVFIESVSPDPGWSHDKTKEIRGTIAFDNNIMR